MLINFLRLLFIVYTAGFLWGCSGVTQKFTYSSNHSRSNPEEISLESGNVRGSKIFSISQKLLGTPYRYGGNDLSGFDCSGLVQYSHLQAGIRVPRTANAQFKTARNVTESELKQGDILFFRLNRFKVSHVGIFAGQSWFIHAPSSGKKVMYSNLEDPYWQTRIVKAGRFY